MRPKKEIKDQVLKKWLLEFKNKHTRECYLSSLRKFKKNLEIKSLDEYVQNNPDAMADIKRFLILLEGKPSKTVAASVAAVKSFFVDHHIPFDETAWKKLKRRGFMPKKIRAETRDKRLTKTQLKKILNYLDVKGRAMVLFLLSSGARKGEILKLKDEDLDLKADPPKAHIRSDYTKNGVGGRTVYFSYEARDAIKDWLDIKDGMKKRNGGTYSKNKVFDWSEGTSTYIWNRAIQKAKLDTKDGVTLRRVYHLHGLRKFFRTKVGLSLDVTNALMGHSEYLDDAYLRLDEKGDIAEAYKGAMPNVSVYEMQNSEVREQTKSIKDENQKLKERLVDHDARMAKIEHMLEQLLNGKA